MAKGTWLDEMVPLQHKQGHGNLGINRSVDNNPLKIGYTFYMRGLGTHANAETIYDLGGRYDRFMADYGVDVERRPQLTGPGSVVFQVWADGERLFDSGVMRQGEPAKSVDVDLRNRQQLRLVVTDAGDGTDSDHADWANARLTGK
jgi:hypothetical protein